MKKIAACKEKIEKIDRDIKTKEEMKNVALGTSKINYMDPRISVSWCKRNEVPIEKVKTISIHHIRLPFHHTELALLYLIADFQ